MDPADSTVQIEPLLAKFSLRQLALWGMAVLDDCCALLEAGSHERPLAQDSVLSRPSDRASVDDEYSDLIREVLDGTKSVLTNVLCGPSISGVYSQVVELTPRAQGLDALRWPLGTAGQVLYVFMTDFDLLWDTCTDSSYERMCPVSSDAELDEQLRGFVEVLRYVAAVQMEEPTSPVLTRDVAGPGELRIAFRDAAEAAELVLRAGSRPAHDVLGPPIPPEIIREVLRRARFFGGFA